MQSRWSTCFLCGFSQFATLVGSFLRPVQAGTWPLVQLGSRTVRCRVHVPKRYRETERMWQKHPRRVMRARLCGGRLSSASCRNVHSVRGLYASRHWFWKVASRNECQAHLWTVSQLLGGGWRRQEPASALELLRTWVHVSAHVCQRMCVCECTCVSEQGAQAAIHCALRVKAHTYWTLHVMGQAKSFRCMKSSNSPKRELILIPVIRWDRV